MNTEIIVTESKWLSKFKNGNDFTELPNDTSINVIGNNFERLKFVSTIRTWTFITLTDYYFTTEFLENQSGNLEGFSVGDICRIVFSGALNDEFVFEVTAINDNIILYNVISQNLSFSLPASFSGGTDLLVVETDLTYLKYSWGLTPSDSTATFESALDGQTLSYICRDIGLRPDPLNPRSTSLVSGIKTAINSNAGNLTVRYVGQADIPNEFSGAFQSAQVFEIEHEFIVQNFSENQIENIINNTFPDEYRGANTLNYDSQFEFRTIERSPETAKIETYNSEGEIGFLNENYNDSPSIYRIENVEITRSSTGQVLENISSAEKCQVTFRIITDEIVFFQDFTTPVIVLNHLTMRSDFQDVKVDFEELFNFQDLRISEFRTEFSSNIITNAIMVDGAANVIDMSFDININDPLLEGLPYFLSVQVGDIRLTNIESDRVNQLIIAGVYQGGLPVLNLIGDPIHDLFRRDCLDFSVQGATSFPVVKSQLLMAKIIIPVLDGEIASIDLQTVVVGGDEVSGVDSERIDLNGFSTINDIQEINEVLPNPYLSPISNGSIRHLGNKVYELIYPFRMPYDETRRVEGLPDSVFNTNVANNGFNEDTFYLQSTGLNVHIAWRIGMLAEGRITFYRYRTPVIQINDFEQSI